MHQPGVCLNHNLLCVTPVRLVDAVMKSEGGRDALYKEKILAGGVNDQIK